MARRIAKSTLNASTIDILNVIRQNASLEYQQTVPAVETAHDIPKVGEALVGSPAMANIFINALVNRIALVRIRSAAFNNPYRNLKKGYLAYGETVEEIFVEIARVFEYSAEKAEAREYKRYIPDVHAAFHVINWRVIYPVTIEDNALAQAFLSEEGVQEMIARIVDSVYTAAEYDEFLLFKYLLIKSVAAGKMHPVSVNTSTSMDPAAVAFRGWSNAALFMRSDLNAAGVPNNTPRDRQIIFMDSMFNAQFDVEVLARAFNMEKADFMGRLHLIDDFTSFDNDRFDVIRANSDGLEEVTAAELALMADVKAILVDDEFFQVYDNLEKFTEKYAASGLYWNYFLHTWKTVSVSPYANAIVFIDSIATTTAPTALVYEVAAVSTDESGAEVINLNLSSATGAGDFADLNVHFVQTAALTAAGVAVYPYGCIMLPAGNELTTVAVQATAAGSTYNGTITLAALAAGDTVTLSKA